MHIAQRGQLGQYTARPRSRSSGSAPCSVIATSAPALLRPTQRFDRMKLQAGKAHAAAAGRSTARRGSFWARARQSRAGGRRRLRASPGSLICCPSAIDIAARPGRPGRRPCPRCGSPLRRSTTSFSDFPAAGRRCMTQRRRPPPEPTAGSRPHEERTAQLDPCSGLSGSAGVNSRDRRRR